MKKLFTLLSLVIVASTLNAQLIWEGSFEEPGFGPLTTSVNGTGSFANAGITNTDDFWLNVWSIDSKGTKVTIVNDFSDGAQAFLFEIAETTTDIRMRTSADAVNFVNGEFVKVTLDAKTDAQGVTDGGKFISVVKNNFTKELTASYATYELYGAIANNRIQIWFPSTGSGESYKVWVDNVRVEKVDAIPVEPVDPEFTNFPYTEDFESGDYTSGNTIAKKDGSGEDDFWNSGTHPLFDRYWRGNFTTDYLCSADGDAYAGSKAMKLAINTLEGNNFRLRSVNVPEGGYTITFKAKTDAAGVGIAKIGFVEDPSTWVALSDTYQEYSGGYTVVVNSSNGTARLIVFFTSDPNVVGSQSYNIWIDDIEIKEGLPTAIGDQITAQDVSLYPNPAQSSINISADGMVEKVEIYSLTGHCVKVISNLSGEINVSDLAKGVYIASVTVDGQLVQKKFTKK